MLREYLGPALMGGWAILTIIYLVIMIINHIKEKLRDKKR